MRLIEKIDNYLMEKNTEIIIKNNKVDIINYDEIIDFTASKITIKNNQKLITIEGTNLVISKMLDNEAMITGTISNVRITN